MMELNDAIIGVSTFVSGIVVTKLIGRYMERKNKFEDRAEQTDNARLERLEETVHRMEMAFANFSGKLEIILPNMNAIGKLREDLAGFYNWKRSQKGDS